MMWHSPLEDRSINYQEHMVYPMQSNRTKLYIKNHWVLILLRSLLVYAVSELRCMEEGFQFSDPTVTLSGCQGICSDFRRPGH